ncbi:reverse transcriptase-like protein [Thermodesulfobacteriota bacterium]
MILYTDGSVRHSLGSGSGGPSGAGAVLMDEQQQVFSKSQPLGHADISVAEAKALLIGLREAIKHCDQLTVKVDHQGLVQALTEDGFSVRGKNMDEMVVLVAQIKEVMLSYNQVKIELIKRKHNLANKPAKKASKQQKERTHMDT